MVKKTSDKKKELEKKPSEKEVKKDSKKLDKWMIISGGLAVLLIISLIVGFAGGFCATGNVINEKAAGEVAIKFASSQGADVEIVEVLKENGMYKVMTEYQGNEIPVYMTLDGKNLISGVYPFEEILAEADAAQEPVQTDAPKSDSPIVELFVMTHCPYGTQAEKGFIPAMELLKAFADVEIRYVHYFMHEPEETETPIQVCIREGEGQEKFIEYLRCFLEGDGIADSSGVIRNGNDPSSCMAEVGINEDDINDCVESGEWEEYYATDSELSQSYGVQGSPTLVVNGVIVNSARDAESYKKTICHYFNDAPSACEVELDSTAPSVYFGWDFANAPASSGSC